MWETWVRFLGLEDPLEKEMAIHSSTLAGKIPWMEEPDRLQSMGSQRVGHDWATSLSLWCLSRGTKIPHAPLLSFSCSVVSNSICSMLGFPILHYLPELVQTHVHWVGDSIQPFDPLFLPSLPAFSFSLHQDIFQWISSSHQVAKVLELQLQHQSFQWISRIGFL